MIGVPDERTGEAVKAFVVPEGAVSPRRPRRSWPWCRDPAKGLTGYRVPKQLEFRDSLPETLIGKVLRRVLIEERQKMRSTSA